MFLWLIHGGVLIEVHLEFMVPGHSYLPCDRSFGVLEKKFREKQTINEPQEYIDIINNTAKSTATRLGHDKIYDFKFLLAFIQFRKAKTVKFSKATRIVLRNDRMWYMQIITPDGAETVDLNKESNQESRLSLPELVEKKDPNGEVTLPLKYSLGEQLKITSSKLKHLQELRPYLEHRGPAWVDSVILGQRTAVDRPRTAGEHTQETAAENLQADYHDDEYTPIPDPVFPPGYLAEDPPPRSQASTSKPSTSGTKAKRRLPQGTTPVPVSKRRKQTHDNEHLESDSD